MNHIQAGVLEVAYRELGPADGKTVILLHGFPYDIHSYDVAGQQLADAGKRVIVPFLRGYGPTRFVHNETPRVGQQAALSYDLLALMDALRVPRAILAGYDWGGRAACVVAALHPDRVEGLVSCGTGYNIQNTAEALKPTDPDAERHHWYWFYLNSDRGAMALASRREEFCRFLWKIFSPSWQFDELVFRQTVLSFNNPDFVPIVLHSYRFRIGAVSGDPTLQGIEDQLSKGPRIAVPTIVLEGGADGVDPPTSPPRVAEQFTQLRRRTVLNGVGHNVPQEATGAFVQAVLEVMA